MQEEARNNSFAKVLCAFVVISYISFAFTITFGVLKELLLRKHLNHSENILPQEILTNVQEILVPRLMQMPQRYEIACFVITKMENRLARSVIRRTWGKQMKPLFVMLKSDNDNLLNFSKNEAQVFDDLIIIENNFDFPKTLVAMKYFIKFFNSSQYFLLTRDDVFINPANLFNMLNDEVTPTDSLIGKIKTYFWRYRHDPSMEYLESAAFLIPGSIN